MDELELLQFLLTKSTENLKYVPGSECINALSLSEQEFLDTVQILEDEKYIYSLKTRSSLPQVKISPEGRKFLRKGNENSKSTQSSITYNVKSLQVSGNFNGGGNFSYTDNRVITVNNQLENLKSQIQTKNMLEDTKKELVKKIDEIKEEYTKNQDPSSNKISGALSVIGNIAADLVPIISRIMGLNS